MDGDSDAARPVLVLGGTGHFGRRIVHSLSARGEPVRVLSRGGAGARALLGDAVQVVEGDITVREDVRRALAGAKAAIIAVSAFSPGAIRRQREIERDAVLGVLDEAQASGVRRVVFISVYELREEILRKTGLDAGWYKLEVEERLAATDLDWTVLGACPSMQLFFALIRAGRVMVVPGGGPPALPTISASDVGEIAAETVLRSDLDGRRIRMTGPEALSFARAAERISAAVGRHVRYQRVPILPLATASVLASPFTPYLRQVVASVRLMNLFPQDLAAGVPQQHRVLLETFSYAPTTLETEARRWAGREEE